MKCLVTAIGSLSAEAVIASLRSLPGAVVLGCNSYPEEWTALSSRVDSFHVVPPAMESQAYMEALLRICRAHRVDYVLPLTDPEVDVLTGYIDALAALGTRVCVADAGAIRVCRDKLLLHEAFAAHDGIGTIPTWRWTGPNPRRLHSAAREARAGRSSQGIVVLDNMADLRHWKRKLKGMDYVVQPRLEGTICVTDVVRQQETGRCVAVSRLELLRTLNGAGLTVEILESEPLRELACRIATQLGINGCINIEHLIQDGCPLLMDINPRFSAGVAFSMLAGYDMVANHLRCFTGAPIDDQVHPARSIFSRHYVEVRTSASWSADSRTPCH